MTTTAAPELVAVLRDADERVGAEFEWYLGSTRLGGATIAPVTSQIVATGTGASFAVSAWVYLTDATTFATVASQPGERSNEFSLYYSPVHGTWAFGRAETDADVPVVREAVADSPAAVDRWTHLVGVYDAGAGKLRLYGNGVRQSEDTFDMPWDVSGTTADALQVGRRRSPGGFTDHFAGRIDEMRVYDQVLPATEVEDLVTTAAVLESRWAFDEKTGGSSANQVPGAPTAFLRGGAGWNLEDPDFSWLFGESSLVLDESGDPDPDPDYVSTDDGDPATQDWVLATDDSYSVSLWAFPYRWPVGTERLPVIAQGGSVTSAFRVEAAVAPGEGSPGGRWSSRTAAARARQSCGRRHQSIPPGR